MKGPGEDRLSSKKLILRKSSLKVPLTWLSMENQNFIVCVCDFHTVISRRDSYLTVESF